MNDDSLFWKGFVLGMFNGVIIVTLALYLLRLFGG
jgi:hypothetical protein